jgi:hypothetical protein
MKIKASNIVRFFVEYLSLLSFISYCYLFIFIHFLTIQKLTSQLAKQLTT